MSWFHWEHGQDQKRLIEFTGRLIRLRKEHPVFRRPKFFRGRRIRGSEIKDVMWFNPGGNEMDDEEWASPFVRCLGMLLSGDATDVVNPQHEPVHDDTFLLLLNAHYEAIQFVLPGLENLEWEMILNTAEEEGFLPKPIRFPSGHDVDLAERSTCLLRLCGGTQEQARQESWKKRAYGLPQAVTGEEERAGKKR